MAALTNQIAVVTGASSGMGRAIALELARHDAHLYLLARRGEELRRTMAQAERMEEGKAEIHPIDLTNDTEIQRFTEVVRREAGRVDVLVHSAGVFAMAPFGTARVDAFDWQYRTNVRAPYLLTQALLPLLKVVRGQIVFINSAAGLVSKPNIAQYAATKFALKAIADSLRAEVNKDGIRVLTIYPGRTATPMQAHVRALEGEAYDPETLMKPESVAAMLVAAVCLPRDAEVTEISIRPMVKVGTTNGI